MPFECIINLVIHHFIMFLYLYAISTWTTSKWILGLDCFHFLKSFPAGILHGDNSYPEDVMNYFQILKYILTYF